MKSVTNQPEHPTPKKRLQYIFIAAGPLLALILYLVVPGTLSGFDGKVLELSFGGRVTIAMAGWMVFWWITEATSLYITSLLPLLILPFAGGKEYLVILESYGHPIIFLALGGFILAAALEKWALHKYFANYVLSLTGPSPRQIVAGFMVTAALLSMWISNTATTIILLPVALGIIPKNENKNKEVNHFMLCLLLGICYSSSIGGMTTLIGTTTNLFFTGYMENELHYKIGFWEWMKMTLPLAILFLPVVWIVLTRFIFPIPKKSDLYDVSHLADRVNSRLSKPQIITLTIFVIIAGSWLFLSFLKKIPGLAELSNTTVAVFGILLLFITPSGSGESGFIIGWKFAKERVPWGVLLLVGGGLTLAKAVSFYGVSEFIAVALSEIIHLPLFILVATCIGLMIFLTEVTTNVASVTALTPIFAALAIGTGIDPKILIIPITVAASFAFMLPVATPPNAIVFGSGLITVKQMARAGLILNISAIIIISIWSFLFVN